MRFFNKIEIAMVFFIIISTTPPCILPPKNCWGASQFEYEYRIPDQEDDGWETSSLVDEGVSPDRMKKLINEIIADNYPKIHCILLIKNGKLILEEYFNKYDSSKIHSIQSCTKSITSILIGIAIDQKIIPRLDDKVYEYLLMYEGTKWIDQKYDITLKHALTMAAGLDWDERTYPYSDLRNDNTAMNKSTEWIEYILNRKIAEPPGERFNYTSGLSILLGEIVKVSSGIGADDFAEKFLFKPLGISYFHWYRNAVHGTIHTGGGLYLRPRDMAKIGHMMLNNGKWNNKQIVSKNWVSESTQNHIKINGFEYGYQWWRGKTIQKNQIFEAFWAAGAGGQFIFVIPELDLVVIFTAQHRDNPGGTKQAFKMLTNYIIPAAVVNYPDKKPVKISSTVLNKCIGEYKYQDRKETIIITIFRKGDRLYARRNEENETVELFSQSIFRFFGTSKEIGDFFINFVKNDKGVVDQFILNFSRGFNFIIIQFDKIKKIY